MENYHGTASIAAAMDEKVSIWWDIAVLCTVFFIAMATLFIVWWSIDKLFRLDPAKTHKRSAIPALLACFGVMVAGSIVHDNVINGPDYHVDDVVAQHIAESFDLEDLQVAEARGYHEEYTANVYGTAEGRAFEFAAIYDPDHDAMVPVLSPQDIDTLPIRDGSTLDEFQLHEDIS